MAQINLTLNQDEILKLMLNDREGAFKKLLQEALNAVMKAESTEQLNAAPYERTNEFLASSITGEYPFLTVDATYFKVREDHRIISKAFMVAYA